VLEFGLARPCRGPVAVHKARETAPKGLVVALGNPDQSVGEEAGLGRELEEVKERLIQEDEIL
jgi:hypothetical protein